jgi:hypothetical protein
MAEAMARGPASLIGAVRGRVCVWLGRRRETHAAAYGEDGAARHGMMPDIPGLPAGLKRDQPLIPVDSAASRALVAVIAILTFLAALAGGAAHMVARASGDWRSAVSNEMTVQIKPDVRRSIDDDLKKAADLRRRCSVRKEHEQEHKAVQIAYPTFPSTNDEMWQVNARESSGAGASIISPVAI